MRYVLLSAVALLTLSTAAVAQEAPKGDWDHHWQPPQSRQEAIERTEKRLQRLKGMTDDEWKKEQEHRQERREKWHEEHGKAPAAGGTPPAAPAH